VGGQVHFNKQGITAVISAGDKMADSFDFTSPTSRIQPTQFDTRQKKADASPRLDGESNQLSSAPRPLPTNLSPKLGLIRTLLRPGEHWSNSAQASDRSSSAFKQQKFRVGH
jgi:hypothetical protein